MLFLDNGLSTEPAEILRRYKTIAVVGLSPKPSRPSFQVASYMLAAGYRIIPVNPGQRQILGQQCYPDLESVPEPVEIVDVFRKSVEVPSVVASAIAVGAKVIWLQLGIVHEAAAQKARAAGLEVVMNRCLKIDHQYFLASGGRQRR